MARIALRTGRSVMIANSRGPESLTPLVSALGDGVSAGTVQQAAAADVVVLAVPWPRVPQALVVVPRLGADRELIASGRLDNLFSAWAGVEAVAGAIDGTTIPVDGAIIRATL